jgi:hypothetical protein
MLYFHASTRTLIDVVVSPRLGGAITQRARFAKLTHTQNEAGISQVVVEVRVTMFDAISGIALRDKGFSERTESLLADNDTAVNPNDGTIMLMRNHEVRYEEGQLVISQDRTDETPEQFLARCEEYEGTVMLQGDFFQLLRDFSNVEIGELIVTHIQQADQMGRFIR